MRILHYLNSINFCTGIANVAIDLASDQKKRGDDVCLVSSYNVYHELTDAQEIPHITIPLKRNPLAILRHLRQLYHAIASFRPDIIHAHMMTTALFAFILKPFFKYKIVTTVHCEFDKRAFLMALGDRVVAVSKAVGESMERQGIRRAKIRVVMNGTIGTTRRPSGPFTVQSLQHPALINVGGMHPRKAVDDLIRAFKLVSDQTPAHLYLIGEGPSEPDYQKLVKDLALPEKVTFLGVQIDPRIYLFGADIFVLSSHADPAPLVISEAREAGCAIIGTSVGGVPEMLDQGKTGLLVPPKRPDLLAEAVLKILRDPQLLEALKAKSRQNLHYFTTSRMTDDYYNVYHELR